VADGLAPLRKAHGLAPGSREIAYHYADALARTGARSEARDVLAGILADDGAFTGREQAQGLLESLQNQPNDLTSP
jgi:hypothetical protein